MSDLTDAADDLDRLEELEPKPGRVGLANRLRVVAQFWDTLDHGRLGDALEFGRITDSDGDYLRHVGEQVQAVIEREVI